MLAAILSGSHLARAQYEVVDACIAANEEALALKKAEKLIDARKALARCAASSCPDAVSTSCRERLSDLIRTIPSIIFAPKDRSGHDVPAVRLTIDGAFYADRLDGSAINLDPGEHVFLFEAAGEEPVSVRLVLQESEQERRETVVIGSERAGGQDLQRPIALALGGAGIAGLVTGAVFGALSLGAHNAYEQYCGQNIGAPSGLCSALAVPGEHDAATKGTLATAFLVGGGLATAIGGAWYLLAPKSRRSVTARITPNGLAIEGRF